MHFLLNPAVRRDEGFRGLFGDEEYRDVHAYFATHPELPPTPLTPLPEVGAALGLGALDVKDETDRFGINAFKILGVRYAVHRLGDEAARNGLVCATAGNHGRAVARVARQKRVPSTIFMPLARTTDDLERQTRAGRVDAMRQDGAKVMEVDGTYEEAVDRAAAFGRASGATVLSDMSWEGYDQIPRWIMAGYTQLFEEAFSQWDSAPSLVIVQGGVGGLICAAASWFAWRFGASRPFIAAAEPEHAACLLASAEAGRPTRIAASLDTFMAGLRCAAASPAAWPAIAAGVDAFLTVPDARVADAMNLLRGDGTRAPIQAGPSGACGLAALYDLALSPQLAELKAAARVDGRTRALVIVTEGLTSPDPERL